MKYIYFTIAFLFIIIIAPSAHAQCGSIPLTYCGPTDQTVRSGTTPTLGAVGTETTDPDFGTKSLRITAGGSCGTAAGSNFAADDGRGWQRVWALDDSQLMFNDDNGWDYVTITGSNPITTTGTCTNVNPTKVHDTFGYSGVTAHLIYGFGADHKTLVSWDTVTADAVANIKDFSTISGFTLNTPFVLGFDTSDAWFCISNNTQENGTQIGCYNKATTNTQVLNLATATERQNAGADVALNNLSAAQLAGCGIHELTVAPDASAIFIPVNGCSAFPAGAATELVWQMGTNNIQYVPNINMASSHSAMGFNSVLINSPGNQPPCGSFSLGWKMWSGNSLGTNGSEHQVGLTACQAGIGEQYDDHLSWLNNKNDANVNTYPIILMGEKDNFPLNHIWPEWEIDAIETGPALTLLNASSFGGNATGKVWRLGHSFNDPATQQCSGISFVSPNVSPDGKYISYTSDYGGGTGLNGGCTNSHRIDVFVLDATTQTTGTAYTVKAAGGGNFTTISACAAVAVAGDTCTIFAGTYNETVAPANSGSSGLPITYTTNPGDTVTVTGWTEGSLSWQIVQGTAAHPMVLTGGVTFSQMQHNIFQYITNISGTGSGACFNGQGWYSSQVASSNNQFLNSTMANCGGLGAGLAAGIEIEGNNNLIDGNTFSHVQSAVQLYGSFNVVRNNHFGPLALSDLGGQHSQPIESSGSCVGSPVDLPLIHMLYENNTSLQWRGGDSHAGFLLRDASATPCGQTSNIIRLSPFMDSGSYLSVTDTKSLNEYFYNISVSNTQLDHSPKDFEDFQFVNTSPNWRSINNILANTTRTGQTDWCIFADGTSQPFVENHNLCNLTGGPGTWWGPTSAMSNTYDASDKFNLDPLFVDQNADLHLQAGSPAIGAGGPLTTAVGSGVSSTSLTVGDAGFFSWGFGIPNVQGDWIRIGASTTVQIASINYGTNTITLASPVTWSNGNSVYLYKDSNANIVLNAANPNIGFDQGAAPAQGGSGTNRGRLP